MILVTGASGFIGRYVCRLLQSRGHDVLALDSRGIAGNDARITVPFVRCDVSDAHAVKCTLRTHPVHTTVHLASALKTASRKDPGLATRVNVGGSVNICGSARESRVRRIVYASSISVYGSAADAGATAVSEKHPAAPEDVYGASKRCAELLGQALCQDSDLQFISLRIASVVGTRKIDGSRFTAEFGYRPVPLQERLARKGHSP